MGFIYEALCNLTASATHGAAAATQLFINQCYVHEIQGQVHEDPRYARLELCKEEGMDEIAEVGKHYAEVKINKFLTSAIEPLQPLQRFLLYHLLHLSQPLGTTDGISNACISISRNIPVDIRH